MKTKKRQWLLLIIGAAIVVLMIMKGVNNDVKAVIKRFEGSVKDKVGNHVAYRDSVGVWTIGYGSTIIDGRQVVPGDKITEAKAIELLDARIARDRKAILQQLTYMPTQNQLTALLSFAYNVGIGGLLDSTLFKFVKVQEHAQAADQFLKWKYGTVNGVKKVLPGLETRRVRERAIYLS